MHNKLFTAAVFHQYSWNSEVETTWISLIGLRLRTLLLVINLICKILKFVYDPKKWQNITHVFYFWFIFTFFIQIIIWEATIVGHAKSKSFIRLVWMWFETVAHNYPLGFENRMKTPKGSKKAEIIKVYMKQVY